MNAYALISEANRRLAMKAITRQEWEQEIRPWADAEPVRHGRWIENTDEKRPALFQRGWLCTACGTRQTYGRSEYCPFCGAKMDEEEE